MGFDKEFIDLCTKRLIRAKMNLLGTNGFYGLLVSNMGFALDIECETAETDGYKIYFGPNFMKDLSDSELEFILMHEVMHVALQHCSRGKDYNHEAYNIAADIVINSNIMHSKGDDLKAITLKKYGVSMHLAPDGKEGYRYTTEEVYEMLLKKAEKKRKKNHSCHGGMIKNSNDESGIADVEGALGLLEDIIDEGGRFDTHKRWKELSDEQRDALREEWTKKLNDAVHTITILESSQTFGGPPMAALRLIQELKDGQLNWRNILTNFLQEEICDYSFSPPDRRFSDGDFFLPDYNEKDETPSNVWFLIDTSGSISDRAIRTAYSEISNAIEQFNGKIRGYLSFTEVFVTDPVPFSSIDDLLAIKPVGGGGNDFGEIFRYMKRNMMDNLPAYIVIITDGYDAFPEEKEAMGIPVLWLINNNDRTPPWGKVARIKVLE